MKQSSIRLIALNLAVAILLSLALPVYATMTLQIGFNKIIAPIGEEVELSYTPLKGRWHNIGSATPFSLRLYKDGELIQEFSEGMAKYIAMEVGEPYQAISKNLQSEESSFELIVYKDVAADGIITESGPHCFTPDEKAYYNFVLEDGTVYDMWNIYDPVAETYVYSNSLGFLLQRDRDYLFSIYTDQTVEIVKYTMDQLSCSRQDYEAGDYAFTPEESGLYLFSKKPVTAEPREAVLGGSYAYYLEEGEIYYFTLSEAFTFKQISEPVPFGLGRNLIYLPRLEIKEAAFTPDKTAYYSFIVSGGELRLYDDYRLLGNRGRNKEVYAKLTANKAYQIKTSVNELEVMLSEMEAPPALPLGTAEVGGYYAPSASGVYSLTGNVSISGMSVGNIPDTTIDGTHYVYLYDDLVYELTVSGENQICYLGEAEELPGDGSTKSAGIYRFIPEATTFYRVKAVGDAVWEESPAFWDYDGGHIYSLIKDRTYLVASSTDVFAMPIGDFLYRDLGDNTVSVYGYISDESDIVIPAAIDGKAVVSVSDLTQYGGTAKLRSVTIPGSVTAIYSGVFQQDSMDTLEEIRVEEGNSAYTSDENGVLFNKDKTELVSYPRGKQGSYTVPNEVTHIGENAFYRCSLLSAVALPDGLTSIGESAFSGCVGLTQMTIPQGVTQIAGNLFYGCENLKEVILPTDLETIEFYAFTNCKSLSTIAIPDSVTYIGSFAFEHCSSLSEISIPENCSFIGSYAFYQCNALKRISVPGAVSHIEAYSFADCSNLQEVILSEGIATIGSHAFEYCPKLSKVRIPHSVTKINSEAFWNSGLTTVTIPGGVTSIDRGAFVYNTHLDHIHFLGNMPTIEIDAFHYDHSAVTLYYIEGTEGWEEHTTYPAEPWPHTLTTDCESYIYTCSICKEVYALPDEDAHAWCLSEEITLAPTCTQEGKGIYYCSDCGTTKEDRIPTTEHSYSYVDNGDSHTRICNQCGEAQTGEHSYTLGKCTACGALKPSHVIPDGYVAIYNPANGVALTTIAYTFQLNTGKDKNSIMPAQAQINHGKLSTNHENIALFTVQTDENGLTTFQRDDGMYLEALSSTVRYAQEPNENTQFILETTDEGYFIRLANDTEERPQYLEYYPSGDCFDAYPKGSTNQDRYIMTFCESEEIAPCEHIWEANGSETPASCGSDGFRPLVCRLCNRISCEILPHGHSYTFTYNEDTHTATCTACGDSFNKNHSFTDGKCTVCGALGSTVFFLRSTELKDGDQVIIYNPSSGMAVTNCASEPYVAAEALPLPEDNRIVDFTEAVVWTVTVNEDGSYSFTNGTNELGISQSEDGLFYNLEVTLGHENKWVFESCNPETETFYVYSGTLTGTYGKLYLEYYSSRSVFTVYSVREDRLTEQNFGFQFYVKQSGDPENPCNHEWDEGKVLTEETCEEDGVRVYTCTLCGRIRSESIPAHGHSYSYAASGFIHIAACAFCNSSFRETHSFTEGKCSKCGVETPLSSEGYVAIYNPAHGMVMTTASVATSSRSNLQAAPATLDNGKLISDANNVALFKITTNENGITTFQTADGKYLEANYPNTGLAEEPNENTEFILDLVEGGFYIRHANFKFNGKTDQYLDLYGGVFTIYGMSSIAVDRYILEFYELETPVPPCEHQWDEGKVTVAPTCTDQGEQCFTCTLCGETRVEAIAPTAEHTYNDLGICTQCGVQRTLDESIIIGHTLDLLNDISINYAVQKTLLEGYDSYYMEFRVPRYEGNVLVGNDVVTVQPVPVGNYYYFTLAGLTAIEMNNVVEATVHMTKDGQEYISKTDSYCVANYAYSQMEKSGATAKLKTLCADLLRYGAAAQTFKGYRTDALADQRMTDRQKAHLSPLEEVSFNNCNKILEDLEQPVVTWAGKTLLLESRVVLRFVVDTSAYDGDPKNLILRISFTDSEGQLVTKELKNPGSFKPENSWYAFDFAELKAAELRTVVSAVVYEGDTQLSPTLQYSVDTYCNGKIGNLGSLCKAMIAYSDSAKVLFA